MGYGGPRLLDQVRDKCRRKNYSIRTEQAYTDWVKRLCCTTAKSTRKTWARQRSRRFSPISP